MSSMPMPKQGGEMSSYKFWGESEEDDITKLPHYYEAKVTDDDRVYFINHREEETHWESPLSGLRYKVAYGLPYGWQRFKDEDDKVVFVDHLSQMCTIVDPRLITKAVYDFPSTYAITDYSSIQNFFRPLATADDVAKGTDLVGKVMIVTGANSGIGYQTSLSLARQGAQVILACRNTVKAEEAVRKIRLAHPGANVEFVHLDLGSLRSVKAFAEEFISRDIPLHVLVCNAGVFSANFSLTSDGFERHFGVNHLGHFYLCKLLMPSLLRSKPSRVVVVTSESHWYPSNNSYKLDLQSLQRPVASRYRAITAYGASKLCNLLFTLEMHRRYTEKGVACTAVHPGNLLPTGLSKGAGLLYRAAFAMARPFTKSVAQGAATVVYCACHPSMKSISGLYMHECWPAEPSPEAQDPASGSALWQLSEDLIQEKTTTASCDDMLGAHVY